MSREAKAMVLLILKVSSDKSVVTLGTWHRWRNNEHLGSSSTDALKKNLEDLQGQVSSGMDQLTQKEDFDFMDVMQFLGQEDSEHGQDSVANDGKYAEVISVTYKEVLQVAKYTMRPLASTMSESARVRDMQTSLQAVNATFGKRNPSSYINYSPVLLSCSFRSKENDTVCQNATTTFTATGLGYSFNSDSFFNQYKRSPHMETFCQEIIERNDQENSQGTGLNKNRTEKGGVG